MGSDIEVWEKDSKIPKGKRWHWNCSSTESSSPTKYGVSLLPCLGCPLLLCLEWSLSCSWIACRMMGTKCSCIEPICLVKYGASLLPCLGCSLLLCLEWSLSFSWTAWRANTCKHPDTQINDNKKCDNLGDNKLFKIPLTRINLYISDSLLTMLDLF